MGMEAFTAPDLTPGYPSQGTKIGPAWTDIWTELAQAPGVWRDGQEVWTGISERYGLNPGTLRGLMFRMAAGGILESKSRLVLTAKGHRSRTHFRIKAQGE
jgi:hypothetical protein